MGWHGMAWYDTAQQSMGLQRFDKLAALAYLMLGYWSLVNEDVPACGLGCYGFH